MKLRILYHGNCFDGVSSAAIFTKFYRAKIDADAEVVRQAMASGVDAVIDTDSHHPSDLVRMDYGVEYARRGWVTTDRVVNAREPEAFVEWLGRRRN